MDLNLIVFFAMILLLIAIGLTKLNYLKYVMMYFISFALYSSSWDLLYSFSGQLSLGHAIPFGVGAFAIALLASDFNFSPIFALVLASLVAAIVGGVIGTTTIRLRPAYQGIAMLLFSQVLYWFSLIKYGDEGISFGFYKGAQIVTTAQVYIFGLFVFVIGIGSIYYIENSKHRLKLIATKDDQIAAEAAGLHVSKYKIAIFFLSSFFAGLAGAFFSLYSLHTDYTIFMVSNSFLPIGMSIIGGSGGIGGAILGSLIISLLNEIIPVYFSLATAYIIYGIMVIVILRFLPTGIIGILSKTIISVKNELIVDSKLVNGKKLNSSRFKK